MAVDLNRNPYYDDFDASKNYTQILAVPGRTIQARDLTQSQTILRNNISQIGDALFANGTIVSGCALSISSNIATIESGKIYLDGAVRTVEQSQVEIAGSGIEYICARVNYQVVTEETDSSLNDPYPNGDNYGKSGSHRLKETVSFLVIQSSEGDTSAIRESA